MKTNVMVTAILLIASMIALPLVFIALDTNLAFSDVQQATIYLLGKIMLITGVSCYIIGFLTNNHSQVDKIWSIMPIIYTWTVAYQSAFNARVVLMSVLVTIWGIRLTYNFSRRGAYKLKFWTGEEDYRWAVLQALPAFKSRLAWQAFHLLFICIYQMALILLFCMPVIVAWQSPQPLNSIDVLLAGIFLALVLLETIADQQQWNYHKTKWNEISPKGFVDSGLWRFVRHPNYLAEQSIWVVFYLIAAIASNRLLNWSMLGCVLLVLLFQGSAAFSEKISLSKYPKYKDYINSVGRFLPKIF